MITIICTIPGNDGLVPRLSGNETIRRLIGPTSEQYS